MQALPTSFCTLSLTLWALVGHAADQSFNIFETRTAADAIAGKLYDKRIGTTISIAIVALRNGALDTSYNKTVTVYLLNGRNNAEALDSYRCRSSWGNPVELGQVTFNGEARVTFSFTYPTAVPSARIKVTRVNDYGCSNDSFAILDTPPSSPYTFQRENP